MNTQFAEGRHTNMVNGISKPFISRLSARHTILLVIHGSTLVECVLFRV